MTGPWNSGHNYQVLVDGLPVPSTLIQEGVLRCICPGKMFPISATFENLIFTFFKDAKINDCLRLLRLSVGNLVFMGHFLAQ